MVVAPVAFIAVFEIGRIGHTGPTVDGIHLTSTYGLIALVLGRGVHGLLVLAPMSLGVTYGRLMGLRLSATQEGAARTNRRRFRQAGLYSRRALTVLSTVALVSLALLIARPATTPQITGSDGSRLPGSVAELRAVEIGGHKQTLLIRGHSTESPVLLYLAGGPGGTDLGAMRIFLSDLEKDFIVVTWDQRGAGKSYASLEPVSTFTLGRVVNDTLEVTNYLRERFDEDKIYLVGNSWGATLGVLAVQQHPELYHAYVGAGQMVSQTETDRLFYEDTLAYAERTGNDGLKDKLLSAGPPPYDDLWSYEPVLAYERQWNDYERVPRYASEGEMPANVFVREYTLLEKLHALPAFLDTFAVLYPQLRAIDFRAQAPSLQVPIYMVQGRHEARGRAVLADEWFGLLNAPRKERFEFERSGHRPHFEEPERFVEVMAQVLRDTYPGR